MAVFFYDHGDHPAGFVGYRVATTLGRACDYKQKYFAESEYGRATGSRLAHELDARWRAEAMDVRREDRLTRTRSFAGPGALVTGLNALLRVKRGKKAHCRDTITPVFVVSLPGYGKGNRTFSLRELGLNEAFRQAVDYYCLVHGLTNEEKNILLKLKPKPDLFIHTLRLNLLKRGTIITAAEVADIIKNGETS